MGRFPIAELVVEDNWDGMRRGEIGEREEVIVDDAGSAVENNKGPLTRCLNVSKDLVPCLTGLVDTMDFEKDLAFHGRMRLAVK